MCLSFFLFIAIAIFHGTKDKVIPVRMGRELAQEFPFIDFFAVERANHVNVLSEARTKSFAE